MPRPKRNELATKDLHRNIQRLMRKRQFTGSSKEIELWGYANLGVYVSDVTLWKGISGTLDPSGCSLEALIVLMSFFDAKPSEMGAVAEQRLMAMSNIFGPDSPFHQRINASGWRRGTAARHLQVVEVVASDAVAEPIAV